MSSPNNIRLTNELREVIKGNLLHEVFKDRNEALQVKETALFKRIVDWYIGDKNLAIMKQLPVDYFCSRDVITPSDQHDKSEGRISSKDGVRVPATIQYGSFEIPSTHAFWKDIRAVNAEKKEIANDHNNLTVKARGMLASVNTVKALLLAWPDVGPYLPAFAEIKSLPAVRVEEINDLIASFKK